MLVTVTANNSQRQPQHKVPMELSAFGCQYENLKRRYKKCQMQESPKAYYGNRTVKEEVPFLDPG